MQLTVQTGTRFSGVFSAQGRSVRGDDWEKVGITFSSDGGSGSGQGQAGRPPCPIDPDLVLWNAAEGSCAPADVGAAPTDAVRSRDGLSWRVLRPGYGTDHPQVRSD